MKHKLALSSLVLAFLLIVLHSCKKEEIPKLSTTTVTNITTVSATAGGNITSDGHASITSRGVCWSLNVSPTISDAKTIDGTGLGQFVSSITGLTEGKIYHVRAYATNSIGTAYGTEITFTTLGNAPKCITQAATDISISGATIRGTVNANDLSTEVTFEYGLTTDYDYIQTAIPSPIAGHVNTDVSLTNFTLGLIPGTTYHYRVKAVNSLGSAVGSDMNFKTLEQIPNFTFLHTPEVHLTKATLYAKTSTLDLYSSFTFEYGLTTDYGNMVIPTKRWVTMYRETELLADIEGLKPGTTYHFRIKGVNSLGTFYSYDVGFQTDTIKFNPDLNYGTVTDIEGNVYRTIDIGIQTWMAENLKTTKLNDGTIILPFGNSPDPTLPAWGSPSYSIRYYGVIDYGDIYGYFYNWYAVGTGKICPLGWHVPSQDEWSKLVQFLGGNYIAGGKLKETGQNHWCSLNEATNESGFTALGGGFKTGEMTFVGEHGYWHTSSEYDSIYSCYWYLNCTDNYINCEPYHKAEIGGNIRCIKD